MRERARLVEERVNEGLYRGPGVGEEEVNGERM